MKKESRTKFAFLNWSSSIISQLLILLLSFVTRTFFVKYLGTEYLGINGLFSNILSMLSLAELGVGSAIIYQLYKPLAENNHKRIILLMRFYCHAYWVIGLVIFIVGIILIPFLPHLIKNYDSLALLNINATFLFFYFIFCKVLQVISVGHIRLPL